MSMARTAARRRRQWQNGFRHLARIGSGGNNRPIYHTHTGGSIHDAIARERRAAALEAAIKRKAKK